MGRSGDGKQNILWGWPKRILKKKLKNSENFVE